MRLWCTAADSIVSWFILGRPRSNIHLYLIRSNALYYIGHTALIINDHSKNNSTVLQTGILRHESRLNFWVPSTAYASLDLIWPVTGKPVHQHGWRVLIYVVWHGRMSEFTWHEKCAQLSKKKEKVNIIEFQTANGINWVKGGGGRKTWKEFVRLISIWFDNQSHYPTLNGYPLFWAKTFAYTKKQLARGKTRAHCTYCILTVISYRKPMHLLITPLCDVMRHASSSSSKYTWRIRYIRREFRREVG